MDKWAAGLRSTAAPSSALSSKIASTSGNGPHSWSSYDDMASVETRHTCSINPGECQPPMQLPVLRGTLQLFNSRRSIKGHMDYGSQVPSHWRRLSARFSRCLPKIEVIFVELPEVNHVPASRYGRHDQSLLGLSLDAGSLHADATFRTYRKNREPVLGYISHRQHFKYARSTWIPSKD